MSRGDLEWRPISSEEMTGYLNAARRERAETMARLFGRIGPALRGLVAGASRDPSAGRGTPVNPMAARGR